MLSIEVGCMDIGRVQPAGAGLGLADADHRGNQPGAIQTSASQRQLIQAVKALKGAELFGADRELTFVFDRQTRRTVVRIIDKRTHEVVMQLPAERVLQMAELRK